MTGYAQAVANFCKLQKLSASATSQAKLKLTCSKHEPPIEPSRAQQNLREWKPGK